MLSTEADLQINSPLGKKLAYRDTYTPSLLYPISRKEKRDELKIPEQLPFKGVDIWSAFEISWLNQKGKPCVALGEFVVSCASRYLFESKSFKYYLNSFSQTKFESIEEVERILERDLCQATDSSVQVELAPVLQSQSSVAMRLDGESLDDQDLVFDAYQVDPSFLSVGEERVSEVLYSDLLKSNCLVTGQPDWGSIQIAYTGKKIERAGLLKYIVSFRKHNGFAEHCVEHIFMDLMRYCAPEELSIYIVYTRRGGLGISPYRSTREGMPQGVRLWRQ